MALRVGTSGFSYKEWKGSFYPADLPAKDMLRFYAERLPAVEINNTFYRMPKAAVLESWAAQVPAGFRFAVKASRRITHFGRLKEVGEETDYLLRTLTVLGERLGAVLFQLPPNLKKDLARLERFLERIAAGTPAVFEFRHESWLDDDVLGVLRERGAALCLSETDEAALGELTATADFGYLRLRRSAYSDREIADWAVRLRDPAWRDAYVFFKHEQAGPALAADLLARAARTAAPARRAARGARDAG